MTTIPLSWLADAGRLDAVPEGVPYNYIYVFRGGGAHVERALWVRQRALVHPDAWLDPSTVMGRAACASTLASLLGLDPMGAVLRIVVSLHYGVLVRIEDMRGVWSREWAATMWPSLHDRHYGRDLDGLPDTLEGHALAIRAVFAHLLEVSDAE